MPGYCDLSARQRDVLTAILVEIDDSGTPVESRAIKQQVADLRDADPTPYTYTVLDQLVDDGWLHSFEVEEDGRLVRYQITGDAWNEIVDRAQLFSPARAGGSSPTDTAPAIVPRN
jgi:DNA-binding PadR family transcriptional regulator